METIQPSQEKASEKILDFNHINEKQIQELKDRIAEHNGLIRIFIHIQRAPDKNGETKYQDREYMPVMRIVSSDKTPPVFFLEDPRDLEDSNAFLELIESRGFLKKPVYIVETLVRMPFPVLENELRPEVRQTKGGSALTREESEYGSKSMVTFLYQLHLLGVKNILLGGNNLVIDGKDLRQCVGLFIEYAEILRELNLEDTEDVPKINLKVSNISAPNNRGDLRGIRDDLL